MSLALQVIGEHPLCGSVEIHPVHRILQISALAAAATDVALEGTAEQDDRVFHGRWGRRILAAAIAGRRFALGLE